MEGSRFLFLLSFSFSFFVMDTFQLQSSQYQVLLQLRKQLEYPQELEIWYGSSRADLCYLSSSRVNITCQEDFVTELKIVGSKNNRENNFDGFAVAYQTLSQNFSVDSLVATLSRLTSLRTLTMVSLGIWGPIPEKIHRLNSLEYLDFSWNFLYGEIPPTISRMAKLHTLRLDGNFFNGSFPHWFDSLPNLSSLSLTENRLSGSLPSSISRLTSLTDIALSKNEISGRLPDLSGLMNLHFLNLSDNKLDSRLPRMPKWLIIGFLGKNSFSGEIPQQYSQLKQLQRLDLSNNLLEGTPPSGLFFLPNLNYLNLASNMLTGQLPLHLSCGNDAGLIDFSNNRLTGSLPSCLTSASGKKIVRYGGNCLQIDLKHQHPEAYCTQAETKKKNSNGKELAKLICLIGGILAILAVLSFGFLSLFRRYFPRGTSEQQLLKSSMQDNSVTGYTSELLTSGFITEAAKFRVQNTSVHRLFSYDELKEATKDFDISALMGEGSSGKIYKGLLRNGTQVAIRCITASKKYPIRNLKLRLDLLAKLRHPHLVCLLGHCIDGEEKYDPNSNNVYLVYEYVSNGNYHSHLSENAPEKALKWPGRLNILVSVAKAIHFLHTGVIPGFYSNRLKANNILLNEHKIAKLCDYGLSIVAEQMEKHQAKEEGPLSWRMKSLEEDDVYSFGIILLESLVGSSASQRKHAFMHNDMASLGHEEGQKRVLDPVVLSTSSEESRSIVISLTSMCISLDSSNRPSFEDILWNLEYAAQTQAAAQG